MCLDAIHATESDASDGHLDAPAPADAQGRRFAWSWRITTISVEDGFPESRRLDLLSAGGERGGCIATAAALLPWRLRRHIGKQQRGDVSPIDIFNLY